MINLRGDWWCFLGLAEISDTIGKMEDDYAMSAEMIGKFGNAISEKFEIDLGNFLAVRTHPIDASRISDEAYLREIATEGTQELVSRLFALDTEDCDVGILAVLPKGKTVFPREKPIPQPKPLTRWQKFADRKGIKKKEDRKDRLVWDEASEDWKPRYGSNRANNKEDAWLMEHKEGDDASVDPWTKMKMEKKERVAKNERQRTQNLIAASGQKLPGNIDLAAAVKSSKPLAKQEKLEKKQVSEMKSKLENTKVTLHLAQQSTASMGKFDRLQNDEPAPKQSRIAKKAPAILQKKQNSAASAGNSLQGEKDVSMKLLNRILEPSKVNVKKAVDIHQRAEESNNRKRKLRA
jgi:regulator of ribosome biosynthesis